MKAKDWHRTAEQSAVVAHMGNWRIVATRDTGARAIYTLEARDTRRCQWRVIGNPASSLRTRLEVIAINPPPELVELARSLPDDPAQWLEMPDKATVLH